VIRHDAATFAMQPPFLPTFQVPEVISSNSFHIGALRKICSESFKICCPQKPLLSEVLQILVTSSEKDSSLWIATGLLTLNAPTRCDQDRSRLCLNGRGQNNFARMNKRTTDLKKEGWKRRGSTTIRNLNSHSAMMMMILSPIGKSTANDHQ